MAKALKLTNVTNIPGGLVFELERLGERFEMTVRLEGMPAMLSLIGAAMEKGGVIVQRELEEMAFAPRERAEGATLALRLRQWPLMAVDLDWSALRGLSALASAALEHAPTPDRPS